MKKKLTIDFKSKCPVCSKSITTLYLRLTDRLETDMRLYSIAQCKTCELAFTNPLPVRNLAVLYPANYLLPEEDKNNSLFSRYRYDQYDFDFRLLEKATGLQPNQIASMLDIGCGSGERIQHAKQIGIRISHGLDKYDNLHGQLRASVINSEILAHHPKKKYQLVTLFHVLEHLDKPLKNLKHIRNNFLANNGVVQIQVPNFDSIERKIFGRRWFSFDVPRHLWHFNAESLTSMLESAGFEVIKIYQQNAFFHPVTIAPSLIKYADPQRAWNSPSVQSRLFICLWAILTVMTIPIAYIQTLLNKGSMLTVVARKSVK